MKNQYPQITVRLCGRSLKELERLSLARSRTRSEIVREAIKVYYQALSTTNIESQAAEYEPYDYKITVLSPDKETAQD